MSYNSKNYHEQGGEAFHVGGNLVFDEPLLDNQAASTATAVAGLKEDFNALLAALKEAGIMEADET